MDGLGKQKVTSALALLCKGSDGLLTQLSRKECESDVPGGSEYSPLNMVSGEGASGV